MIRPYGDTTGDGMVQLSFTLPVPPGPRADGAALQLATKMGVDPAMVVHSHGMGEGFTFFVVYGSVRHLVDLDAVAVEERAYPLMTPAEVDAGKKSLLEARRLQRTQDSALAARLGSYLFAKRTFAWDIDFEKRIAALTPAQVNAALKRHIDPERVSVVTAGSFKK